MYEFLRNSALDARNYFSPTRGTFIQNQFGGTLGGPIVQEKVFFFSDYQGTRQIQGTDTGLISVPSMQDRTGDLSDQAALSTGTVSGAYFAALLSQKLNYAVSPGEPYYTPGCVTSSQCVLPGAQIPQSAWSGPAMNLLKYIPEPNLPGNVFSTSAFDQILRDNKIGERIDANTRWGTIFGYYSLDNYSLNNPYPTAQGGANVPGFNGLYTGRAQLAVLGDNKTIGTGAVSEFRLSYTRDANDLGKPAGGLGVSLASQGFVTGAGTLGIVPLAPKNQGVENVFFNNFTIGSVPDEFYQINNGYELSENLSKLVGRHSIKFGAQFDYDQINTHPFADLTPDLQLQTIGQQRSLTNAGGRASLSYVKGANNIKAGLDYSQTFLDEADTLGIVDPAANAVCLYRANGTADTNPALTNPSACTGTLEANTGQGVGLDGAALPAFNPLLACYDLTRTAALPGSDDCPNSTSGEYTFFGRADIRELALYVEDSLTKKNWTFNLGLRGDLYRGISSGSQLEPRLGIAYNIKRTSSVLQISYARTLETPFNENLVLASLGCNNPVISAIEASTISPCVATTPLSPGWRNEFHAGLQQAFGRYFVLNGEYIWKYTHKAYDFSILGNTPITFPIEWDRSKIPGFAVRGTVPNVHGFTAYIVMSHVAARFFEPQVSGIGAAPAGSEVFRIDHDENFNQTTHIQYQPWKRGPWIGFNWRYDSGLVAGPVPCAGGEDCANGPNGTDSIVDVSGLSPDQQFQAGLFCGSVHATPTTPIGSSLGANLCPAAQYGSPLLSIPAAGTEDDDHDPPRIAPRNLFDASIGDDNLFHKDRFLWSLRFTVINLTNKVALYNFLSTFSGTHYVSPRTETAELGFHF